MCLSKTDVKLLEKNVSISRPDEASSSSSPDTMPRVGLGGVQLSAADNLFAGLAQECHLQLRVSAEVDGRGGFSYTLLDVIFHFIPRGRIFFASVPTAQVGF